MKAVVANESSSQASLLLNAVFQRSTMNNAGNAIRIPTEYSIETVTSGTKMLPSGIREGSISAAADRRHMRVRADFHIGKLLL